MKPTLKIGSSTYELVGFAVSIEGKKDFFPKGKRTLFPDGVPIFKDVGCDRKVRLVVEGPTWTRTYSGTDYYEI